MENYDNLDKEMEENQLKIFFQKTGQEETLANRYQAGTYLLDKLNKKLEAIQKMIRAYQAMRNQVQMEAVEQFKNKLREDFVTTYYDTKHIIDPKMQEDFAKLEAIEKHSCFLINGVEVKIKECSECKKRCENYTKVYKEFNFTEPEPVQQEFKFKKPTEEEEQEMLNELIDDTELNENDLEETTVEYKED